MFRYIQAKTMITKTNGAKLWFGNDFNMNIYRGCTHGCIYCDSRSECYHIENFDEILIKENAITLIEKELSVKRITGVVGTGSMSDPYNIYEKKLMLTRNALVLLDKYKFGAGICTKSDLIVRDSDILSDIIRHSQVTVCMTVTAADDSVSKVIEPQAPSSSKRFRALKELNGKGIFAGVLMMPLLMGITDSPDNIAGIVDKAAESGVSFIYPAFGLSMRDGNREYLYKKLDIHYPGLRKKYEDAYGKAYICEIPESGRLSVYFIEKCRENGILYKMEDIITAAKSRVLTQQASFFV